MEADQKQLEMELANGGGNAASDGGNAGGDGKPTNPVEVHKRSAMHGTRTLWGPQPAAATLALPFRLRTRHISACSGALLLHVGLLGRTGSCRHACGRSMIIHEIACVPCAQSTMPQSSKLAVDEDDTDIERRALLRKRRVEKVRVSGATVAIGATASVRMSL